MARLAGVLEARLGVPGPLIAPCCMVPCTSCPLPNTWVWSEFTWLHPRKHHPAVRRRGWVLAASKVVQNPDEKGMSCLQSGFLYIDSGAEILMATIY